MAKKNLDIIENNVGLLKSYAVPTVKGNNAFLDDTNKQNYINLLLQYENDNICLIAYCITNKVANFIVKGINKNTLDNYVKSVNRAFYSTLSGNGYPFAPTIMNKKISNANLANSIIAVHSCSPCDPTQYSFCSYNYLLSGFSDATKIIEYACKKDLSQEEFELEMRKRVKNRIKEFTVKEKFATVFKQDQIRYIDHSRYTEESNIMFMLGDVCTRTQKSYYFVAKKMGIPKKRRDIMIGVLCDLVIRRNMTIQEAIANLKLKKESMTAVVLEVIAEINRVFSYSYDYITNLLGISDMNYNLLVSLITGIHNQLGDTFETICVRFHLQNDIIMLRTRCRL